MKAVALKTFQQFSTKKLITPGKTVEGDADYIKQLVANGFAKVEEADDKKSAPKTKAKTAAPENKAK